MEVPEQLLTQRDDAIRPSAPLRISLRERFRDRRYFFVGSRQGYALAQARDWRIGGGKLILKGQRFEDHLQRHPDTSVA